MPSHVIAALILMITAMGITTIKGISVLENSQKCATITVPSINNSKVTNESNVPSGRQTAN